VFGSESRSSCRELASDSYVPVYHCASLRILIKYYGAGVAQSVLCLTMDWMTEV
jgi:hypothetical protein